MIPTEPPRDRNRRPDREAALALEVSRATRSLKVALWDGLAPLQVPA